jgi:methylmalonyl-CoA mutase N-terminal domain/subunit
MFFRLALPGARRVLIDHIAFARRHLPKWNPLSIVGQHMQQAGATPAEAMGLTLSSAIQYATDCLARGWDPDQFLPRFTFFFDISISFFEEVAKFRAGRRIWASLARERFGAKDAKSWRFKFHGQTSGVDLTREQPLNNIARVTVQAMAGILGGLQSLHTDAFDEVMSVPTERAARIAVSTQNILKEEAHLTDVADALGGSYYVEALTDEMEAKIREVIGRIDAAGGMYAAVEAGLPQQICGDSALAFQEKVDRGEETIVGINKYRVPAEEEMAREALKPPPKKKVEAQLKRLTRFKAKRSEADVRRALDALTRAAESKDENVYEKVVDAACAGVTHGEICAGLRKVYGFGAPLIVP